MTVFLIVLAILLVFGVFGWAVCRGAAIADRRSEQPPVRHLRVVPDWPTS